MPPRRPVRGGAPGPGTMGERDGAGAPAPHGRFGT
ncbi:hypothetical protein SFR_1682 [Streptomyces sp. FR-008]|nr:hypothetical protein SFR_1682 [Streptomyces sp. FR-008]